METDELDIDESDLPPDTSYCAALEHMVRTPHKTPPHDDDASGAAVEPGAEYRELAQDFATKCPGSHVLPAQSPMFRRRGA